MHVHNNYIYVPHLPEKHNKETQNDTDLILYGPQIGMYYLYAYDTVESGIKQLN